MSAPKLKGRIQRRQIMPSEAPAKSRVAAHEFAAGGLVESLKTDVWQRGLVVAWLAKISADPTSCLKVWVDLISNELLFPNAGGDGQALHHAYAILC